MAQLYFYYSAMNAGKSTALLQSSYNYQERGMRTVVYTAEMHDDRFGAGKVSSRIGLSSPAKLFNQNSSLFDEIRAEHEQQAIHCVLVDECQFLTRQQAYELSEVVDQLDIPVLCYGLRTDFRGELFIGSQYLLAWSDKLVELKTICFCGRKASMVLRLDQAGRPYNEGEQVVIGGNERYVSVCRKHYKEALEVGSLTAIQERHRHDQQLNKNFFTDRVSRALLSLSVRFTHFFRAIHPSRQFFNAVIRLTERLYTDIDL
ncbi:thymidine kinase [Escherichia coli]|uniref:Thymidine kinase n=9 Tax=Escherichia coli TaxID=562 RepID=A0A8S0FVP3_ECOLX|nr:thymidine kinase [Escherichia coli]